ncbi:IS110 family transposase, partial [Primorskyibacter sp. 2E107]
MPSMVAPAHSSNLNGVPRVPEMIRGIISPRDGLRARMTRQGGGYSIHTKIGIDVSKAKLDVFCSTRCEYRQFGNTTDGLAMLLRWVASIEGLIVFEASGAYHRELERMLTRRGLTFAKVNPRQARRFAEAIGRAAKTDRLDAEMLARMGSALQLQPTETHSEALGELRELLVFRRGLIKDRTAAKTRLKTARLAMLRRLLTQRLGQIERQLARVDIAMKAIVASDPALVQRSEILTSIPGISTTSAMALLTDMPELGMLSGKQAAARAGLAPISRQSGQWQGRERIQGGRHTVRQAMFMPTLCAIQHNHAARSKFEELVRAGKPRKLAVTAVMR